MRPIGTAEQLEDRRRRAAEMLQAGLQQCEVAERLGVRPSSVSKWAKALRENGEDGLQAVRHPRAPALSDVDLARLETVLLQGPEAHGFRNGMWTCRRVAEVVRRLFAVDFTQQHIGKILRERLQWSPQKPETAARERNEEAIATWRKEQWPLLKKKPATKAGRLFS